MRLRRNGHLWAVETPAKLNLFLEVLGKRSDGFHDLETVMVTFGLFDSLLFEADPSGGLSLTCRTANEAYRSGRDRSDIPAGPENLVLQAAGLLRSVKGCRLGCRIHLLKRIPAAAGLGGGSSDAAATLFALNQIWKLELSRETLMSLGAKLGSDVSFFLAGTSMAVCRGRGEQIEPLFFAPRLHFVIARPAVGLSTPQVFRHCRPEANPRGAARLVHSLRRGDLRDCRTTMFNSLQQPAEQLCPELKPLRESFEKLSLAGHMMSGSGTSWFGVCRHRGEAMRAAARLRASGLSHIYVAGSPP